MQMGGRDRRRPDDSGCMGEEEAILCETNYEIIEMQGVLREVLRALSDFRRLVRNSDELDSFHEDLILPPLPSPAWPLEQMTNALKCKSCSECSVSSADETITHSSRKRSNASDTRRRRALSAERRKRRRSSHSDFSGTLREN